MPKKLIDLELLSRFKDKLDTELDKKANVDGNYPTLTVGLADNLTPYSEDSGAEQTNPFISNGTGTNNNTEIVTVGDYGLLKSKNGNTLVVNQLVQNGDFSSEDDNWTTINCSASVSNKVCSLSISSNTNYGFYQTVNNKVSNHIMLIAFDTVSTENQSVNINWGTLATSFTSTTTKQRIFKIFATPSSGNNNLNFTGITTNGITLSLSNIVLIDLTQMFNGDIPQDLLDNPSHFSWYYNGDLSYNAGTLVNASGVKLVSTSRQQWDEEWEQGSYDSNGQPTSTSNAIRNKNKVIVIPNTTYYVYKPANASFAVHFWTKNNEFIGGSSLSSGKFVVPSNCEYVNFYLTNYGTTYNHDITISLYYSPEQGGEGYSQYYPYEEPYVVDTGSEVLRSAGSVYDYKEPNGTIHRLVGISLLENMNFTYDSGNARWYSTSLQGTIKNVSSNADKGNIVCSNLQTDSVNNAYTNPTIPSISVSNNGTIYIYGLSGSATISGTLNYELATPTTEQGTPFSTNLPINDYGMLYWLDSSNNLVGIPQGSSIFYPTNYKGFVDDMYSRVDGDSGAYVIQSELSAEETARSNQDTILLNAIGGTLRQLLASGQSIDFLNTAIIDLGDIVWAEGTIVSTIAMSGVIKAPTDQYQKAHILCTKYQTSAQGDSAITSKNLQIAFSTGGNLRIYDTSLSNKTATEIQQALKGILLAYEKA